MPSLRDRARNALGAFLDSGETPATALESDAAVRAVQTDSNPAIPNGDDGMTSKELLSAFLDSFGGIGSGGRTAAQFGNLATGLGIPGKDPFYSSFWSSGTMTSENEVELDALTREALARKIVGAPWADALRPGFDLRGLPDALQEIVHEQWDRLQANQNLWRLNYLGDFWGDAVCVVGANDFPPMPAGMTGQDRARIESNLFEKPLNMERLSRNREVLWLRPFGRRSPWGHSSGYTRLEQGPIMSERFGEPELYRIHDFWAPARPGYRDMTRRSAGPLTVHYSRTLQSTTWDAESVFVGLDAYLKNFMNALSANGRAISTLSVSVMKIKNWLHKARHDRETARARVALGTLAMSMLNALIVDKDEEDHEFQGRNISGLSDSVLRTMEALAAAADMPMIVLFGLDPGGFSSGSEIIDRYLAKVSDYQEKRLTPQVRRLVEILLAAYAPPGEIPDSATWQVEWRPPRMPTEEERAKTREATFKALKAANEAIQVGVGVPGALTGAEVLSTISGDAFTVDPKLMPGRPDPAEAQIEATEQETAAVEQQGGDSSPDPQENAGEPTALQEPTTEPDDEAEVDAEPPPKMPGEGHTLRTAQQLADEFGVRQGFVKNLGRARKIGMLPKAGPRGVALFSLEDFKRARAALFQGVAGEDDSIANPPRTFTMVRKGDIHGVSGTGEVMDGVVWPNGRVTTRWMVEGKPTTETSFDSYQDYLDIHVNGHEGNGTQIAFHDGKDAPAATMDADPTLFLDPFPNFHAARQRDPGAFVASSLYTIALKNGVQIIEGRLTSGGEAVQTVRLPAAKFTPEQARSWLRERDYSAASLEPASES